MMSAMQDAVSDLVARGSQLPFPERERLVDELLESLNERAAAALDTAWEAEIERRIAEYNRGEVHAVDAEVVFAKARRIAVG